MMTKKLLAVFLSMLILLIPFSSITVSAERTCTVQEQIDYICSLGDDSTASCSAEWATYGQDLNELIMLREAYGLDKQLSETNYKGSCQSLSAKSEPDSPSPEPAIQACTIQERINWLCSKEGATDDCTAEYGIPEYSSELNKLTQLREAYGQTKLLSEIGYEQDVCGEKSAPIISEKTEDEKTIITSEGMEVEINNGVIAGCKKDGVPANCPLNEEVLEIYADESDAEEIVPNSAKISSFIIGNGKGQQLYTPYSMPEIDLVAFGEKGTELAIIIWLTDKNGERIVPVKISTGFFGEWENDFIIRYETFNTLVDDGEYNVLAELWQDEQKRDEKYFTVEGEKASVYILEKANEISDHTEKPTEEEVAEKLYAFLDARYKHSKDSAEYKQAFKEFMKAYIRASYDNPLEIEDSITALEGQDLTALIEETETTFRKEIQLYYIEAGIAAMNVAYDAEKDVYDAFQSFDWSSIVNWLLGFDMMIKGSSLEPFNPGLRTLTKNPLEIDSLRSALMIARKYVNEGGDYNELYERMITRQVLNPEEDLLSETMSVQKFKPLFEAIRNTDSAGFHYHLGKIFTDYSVFAFIDADYVLEKGISLGSLFGENSPFAAYTQVDEEYLYVLSSLTIPKNSGVTQELRNMIQLGQDQFNIVGRLYPESEYTKNIESTNKKLQGWSDSVGFKQGVYDLWGILQGGALMVIGGVGVASIITKIPAIASRIGMISTATKAIMFSGAVVSGVETLGGCIDYMSAEKTAAESGNEWARCYVPAATTILFTTSPMKIAPKSIKPFIRSEQGKALFSKNIPKRAAAPAIIAAPIEIPTVPKMPKTSSIIVEPEAAAAAVAEQTVQSAEKIASTPHISPKTKITALDKLNTWMSDKKMQKAESKAKQAKETVAKKRKEESKKIEQSKPAVKGGVNVEALSYNVDEYAFKGKIIRYADNLEVYALSDPHGSMYNVLKGLEEAKLIGKNTRDIIARKYSSNPKYRITDAEIAGITNEVSSNLKKKAFVILGDVNDVEMAGLADYGEDIMRLVMSLEKKTNYRVTSLMGNHEAARLGHIKIGKGDLVYDIEDIKSSTLINEFITSRPVAAVQGNNKVFFHSGITGVNADVFRGSRAFTGSEFYLSFYGREYFKSPSDEIYSILKINKDAVFIEGHTPLEGKRFEWKGKEFIISPGYASPAINTAKLPK